MIIVPETDSALNTKSSFIDLNTELKLIEELTKILIKTRALGIAANQVGETKHLFLVANKFKPPTVFANSIIKSYSHNEIPFEEGCLSFPDLYLSIIRPENIIIQYQTIENNEIIKREKIFNGLSARVIQHEFDHVEGIVFTEKFKQTNKHNILE